VVPAALAAGEEFGIDGARFLRAVTLGYDIGTRVVLAMGGAEFSYQSSFATHSIAGTFGAAAAAACAAGLDARQMRWALDYTAQQSSGIVAWRRDTDHIEKAFVFGGMPARSGVTSALLVRSGWNGVDDVFSGADNFFQAYAPKAQPARLIEKLGERYEIAQTDIKKWTVGSPIQGPLDAIEAIRGKQPFAADQVQRVTVRLAPSVAAVVDNRDIPDICLQHMIAVMLVDKTVWARPIRRGQMRRRVRTPSQGQRHHLPSQPDLSVLELHLAAGTSLSRDRYQRARLLCSLTQLSPCSVARCSAYVTRSLSLLQRSCSRWYSSSDLPAKPASGGSRLTWSSSRQPCNWATSEEARLLPREAPQSSATASTQHRVDRSRRERLTAFVEMAALRKLC
jgi:hypothetical protein